MKYLNIFLSQNLFFIFIIVEIEHNCIYNDNRKDYQSKRYNNFPA